MEALGATYGLTAGQRARLADACARWFASEACAEALAWPLQRAEVPFCVPVGDMFMEGEIDLLCTESAQLEGARALVFDYKTGGSDEEKPEALYEKHLLQAQCYAFALLERGCEEVELRFVRVEREDGQGRMQSVRYRFAADERDKLERAILKAREA